MTAPAGLEFKDLAPALRGCEMEFKTAAVLDPTVSGDHTMPGSTDAGPRLVTAVVAVTGVRDEVGDTITPGAFTKTLIVRPKPKVCLGHDWNRPIGRTREIKELLPGDPSLPPTTYDGKPWPRNAGALLAVYEPDPTKEGVDAYNSAKFYGPQESTYSIGYKTMAFRPDPAAKRFLDELAVFEYSQVLIPAHPLATLQDIKAGLESQDVETKASQVRDVAYWGLPYGTPITVHTHPHGPKAREERRSGRVPSRQVGTMDANAPEPKRVTADDRAAQQAATGLFPEPASTARVVPHPTKAKGQDQAHIDALASEVAAGNADPDTEDEDRAKIDKAIRGLLNEAITPSEVRERLSAHPAIEAAGGQHGHQQGEPGPHDADIGRVANDYAGRYAALAHDQQASAPAPIPANRFDTMSNARLAQHHAISSQIVSDLENAGAAPSSPGHQAAVANVTGAQAEMDARRAAAMSHPSVAKAQATGLTLHQRNPQDAAARAQELAPTLAQLQEHQQLEPPRRGGRSERMPHQIQAMIHGLNGRNADGSERSADSTSLDNSATVGGVSNSSVPAGQGKEGLSPKAATIYDALKANPSEHLANRITDAANAIDDQELARSMRGTSSSLASRKKFGAPEDTGSRLARNIESGQLPGTTQEHAENRHALADALNRLGLGDTAVDLKGNAKYGISDYLHRQADTIHPPGTPGDTAEVPAGATAPAGRRTLTDYSDADLETERKKQSGIAFRAGNFGTTGDKARTRIKKIEVEQSRRADASRRSVPAHRMSPEEYQAAGDRASNIRFRQEEMRSENDRANQKNAMIDKAEQVAATAPESIADVPEGAEPVADGRMLLANPKSTNWSLRTADNKEFIRASDFATPAGKKAKLNRAAINDLAHTVAGIQDGKGSRVPLTAPDSSTWAGGFRDSEGHNLAGATAKAVQEWAAGNNLTVHPSSRLSRSPEKPGRPVRTDVADADGFYPDQHVAMLSPGDEVRLPDGSTRTLAWKQSEPVRGNGGYVRKQDQQWNQTLHFSDGTSHELGTRNHVTAARYANGGSPMDPALAQEPGMGFTSASNLGARMEDLRPEDARTSREALLGTLAPGTRFVARHHAEGTDSAKYYDTRPKVGTITNRVSHVEGTPARVLEYDDGTFDATTPAGLKKLNAEPTDQEIRDVRAAWGLPNADATDEPAVPDAGVPRAATTAPSAPVGPPRVGNSPAADADAAVHADALARMDKQQAQAHLGTLSRNKLRAIDAEFTRRAVALGKPEAQTPRHTMVRAAERDATYDALPVHEAGDRLEEAARERATTMRVAGRGDEEINNAVDTEARALATTLSSPHRHAANEHTAALGHLVEDFASGRRFGAQAALDEHAAETMTPQQRAERADHAQRASQILVDSGVGSDHANSAATNQLSRYAEGLRDSERARAHQFRHPEETHAQGTSQISPEALDEVATLHDTTLGLHEDDDGHLEVEPDVAARQDRVSALLDQHAAGKLTLTGKATDELHTHRRDLTEELRLQEELAQRPGAPAGATTSTKAPATRKAATEAPPVRPGLAGATQDHAEALRSGDAEAIARTRTRLDSSVRRSRAGSASARAIADHVGTGGADAESLEKLAGSLKGEARARRNSAARSRRTAKRLDRERIRSVLGSVDSELRSRGESPEVAATPGAPQPTVPTPRITDTAPSLATFTGDESATPGRVGKTVPRPTATVTPTRTDVAPLTDEQYAAYTHTVATTLDRELGAGRTTDVMHTHGGNGVAYTPARVALHKDIVDSVWAQRGARVPREGRAVLAGGLMGAGKSTVLSDHAGIDTANYLTVDPDALKEEFIKRDMVPKVEGLTPMEAAPLVHEESGHVAKMLAKRAYQHRTNLIWDVSMSSKGSMDKRIQAMAEHGYARPDGVFVDIPVETSVERAAYRHRTGLEQFRSGEGIGGRYVPPDVIRQQAHATKSSANRDVFDQLADQFGSHVVFDNSVFGREPRKVAGTGRWKDSTSRDESATLVGVEKTQLTPNPAWKKPREASATLTDEQRRDLMDISSLARKAYARHRTAGHDHGPAMTLAKGQSLTDSSVQQSRVSKRDSLERQAVDATGNSNVRTFGADLSQAIDQARQRINVARRSGTISASSRRALRALEGLSNLHNPNAGTAELTDKPTLMSPVRLRAQIIALEGSTNPDDIRRLRALRRAAESRSISLA